MSFSRSIRHIVNLFALGIAICLASVPALHARAERAEPRTAADGVTWERDTKSPHWVHGQVDVTTPPAAVWERIQKVEQWPTLFSDVKWIKVEERSENRWRVRLETRSMDCGAHNYSVTFDSRQRRALLQIDAPGIESTARLLVRQGSGSAKANVAYSLYVRATGVVGWFVSEKALHKKQEHMVERNLRDLGKAFGVPPKSR